MGVPSSQALPGYLSTAPPSVCVPAVIGVLAVWIQQQKNQKKELNCELAVWRIQTQETNVKAPYARRSGHRRLSKGGHGEVVRQRFPIVCSFSLGSTYIDSSMSV